MITSVAELIKELGGTEAAAKAFDRKQNVVGMWRLRGRLPPWEVPKAMEIARVNKLRVSPAVFEVHRPKRKRGKATT